MKNKARNSKAFPSRSSFIKTFGKKRNVVILFLLLLILTFLFAFIIVPNKHAWDGKRRINLIIRQEMGDTNDTPRETLFLLSIEPRQARAIGILIPSNVSLLVPFGYDTYPATSVYRLGELEKKGKGGMLLARSIETTFGPPVEGYITLGVNSYISIPKSDVELKEVKQKFFSLLGIGMQLPNMLFHSSSIKTNVSLLEMFRLWNAIRRMRADQITFIDLSTSSILQDEVEPDNTIVRKVDQDRFDTVLGNQFEDSDIRRDQLSLEVINASLQSGLAGSFSHTLTLMGAIVVKKSTAKEPLVDSCIIKATSELQEKAIIQRLIKLYGCQTQWMGTEMEESDIRIVLGKNFIQW